MSKIIPGCWVETLNGDDAVCIEIKDESILYRYPATPFNGGKPEILKQIWPLSCCNIKDVKYIAPPNIVSDEVLKLEGPYGLGK